MLAKRRRPFTFRTERTDPSAGVHVFCPLGKAPGGDALPPMLEPQPDLRFIGYLRAHLLRRKQRRCLPEPLGAAPNCRGVCGHVGANQRQAGTLALSLLLLPACRSLGFPVTGLRGSLGRGVENVNKQPGACLLHSHFLLRFEGPAFANRSSLPPPPARTNASKGQEEKREGTKARATSSEAAAQPNVTRSFPRCLQIRQEADKGEARKRRREEANSDQGISKEGCGSRPGVRKRRGEKAWQVQQEGPISGIQPR